MSDTNIEQVEVKPEPPMVLETKRTDQPATKVIPAFVAITKCPFCASTSIAPRPDKKKGYECPHCESIFLGPGTGIHVDHGVIDDIANAKDLPSELLGIKECTVTGRFRGNAVLKRIPEITLPSMAGVALAASLAGMKVEHRTETTIFLIREGK